jgi:hypothetical protein
VRLLIPLWIALTMAMPNEDTPIIDEACRHAVQQHASEVFLEFRFPDADEILGDWRFHGVTSGEDPACKTAILDIDEAPDYVALLLPRSVRDKGFGLFAMTSFWSDGTVRYTVYPLHAETPGVLGETVLRITKRRELRDDENQVLDRGRGWLQIRSPRGGEEFRWCRNADNPNPRRGLDSVEYVMAFDANMVPTRLARFHWNTAGHFTRWSYCRVE